VPYLPNAVLCSGIDVNMFATAQLLTGTGKFKQRPEVTAMLAAGGVVMKVE
jgi:hypothetical protein